MARGSSTRLSREKSKAHALFQLVISISAIPGEYQSILQLSKTSTAEFHREDNLYFLIDIDNQTMALFLTIEQFHTPKA